VANSPVIEQSAHLAVEKAFAAYLLEQPELSTGVDIVAASDRSARVQPKHVFVLCTEFAPIVPAGPQGTATVAIGVVTDMDEDGEAVRADLVGRISRALSDPDRQVYDGSDAYLQGWSIKSTKDESADQKVMDVFVLRVGATV
jgi:hypothetical protein